MKIDIKTDGFELESELNHFTMCCAAFELGTLRGRIESVQIHLTHAHEARDSRDRHCQVEVNLSDGHTIVSRDVDMDLHVAIFRAMERAGWMSTRQLSDKNLPAGSLPVPPQPAVNAGEPFQAA